MAREYLILNYLSNINMSLLFVFSLQVLSKIVNDILTVPCISRVMYDLTSKPPGTIEWE